MNRQILNVLLLVGIFLPSVAAQEIEPNTDRPGQNYRNFDLDMPKPELCQAACMEDGKCKAWTYVKPGIQGNKARCWLKSAVPPSESNECCMSGVKSTGAASSVGQEPMKMQPYLMEPQEKESLASESSPAVVPKVAGKELLRPQSDLVEQRQLNWIDNIRIGLRSNEQPHLVGEEDACWEERFKQCQQWDDDGNPPPMPPMDPACAQYLLLDPCKLEKINCAKIPCPAGFKEGITCWECH